MRRAARPATGRGARAAAAAGLAWAAVTALTGCSDARAGAAGEHAVGGGVVTIDAAYRRPVPSLAGERLDGQGRLDLGSVRGSVVLVNWYASWCAPCQAEAAELRRVEAAEAPRGVRFVAVDLQDSRVNGASFLARNGIRWPTVFDEPGLTLLGFHGALPASPPDTVLLDRAGRVAVRISGSASASTLQPLLDSLLAERA